MYVDRFCNLPVLYWQQSHVESTNHSQSLNHPVLHLQYTIRCSMVNLTTLSQVAINALSPEVPVSRWRTIWDWAPPLDSSDDSASSPFGPPVMHCGCRSHHSPQLCVSPWRWGGPQGKRWHSGQGGHAPQWLLGCTDSPVAPGICVCVCIAVDMVVSKSFPGLCTPHIQALKMHSA